MSEKKATSRTVGSTRRSETTADANVLEPLEAHIAFTVRSMAGTANLTESDAEDLAQEFRAAVLRAMPFYDKAKGTFATYMYRVIANQRKNIYRHRMATKRDTPTPTLVNEAEMEVAQNAINLDAIAAEETLERDIAIGDIHTILGLMTAKQRNACALLMSGCSIDATAVKMKMSKTTFRRTVLAEIRTLFIENGYGNGGIFGGL